MARKVIYTCLTSGYDVLQEPLSVSPEYDYICFTDLPRAEKGSCWRLLPLPAEDTPVKAVRRYKILPHEILGDYDWSVYMDANIRILSQEFYDIIDRHIVEGTPWRGVPHPVRDCIWDETEECWMKGKLPLKGLLSVSKTLKDTRFPRHFGLFENNLILRRHMDPAVIDTDKAWWAAFEKAPYRDQLCLMGAMREFHMEQCFIFEKGKCARNVQSLAYTVHPGEQGKRGTQPCPALKRFRRKCIAALRRCIFLVSKC